MVDTVTQTNVFEGFLGAFLPVCFVYAGVDQRKRHIIEGSAAGQQVKRLEYKTDLGVAYFGQFIIGHVAHVDAIEDILPFCRRIQAA